MLRVVRPGGRIGLANWTPEGFIGQPVQGDRRARAAAGRRAVAGAVGHRAAPASTCSARRPRRSAASGAHFNFRYRSAAHWVQVFRDYYGPTHKAFAALDAAGQQALERDITALLDEAQHRRAELAGGARASTSKSSSPSAETPLHSKENHHETQAVAQVRKPGGSRFAKLCRGRAATREAVRGHQGLAQARRREGHGQGKREEPGVLDRHLPVGQAGRHAEDRQQISRSSASSTSAPWPTRSGAAQIADSLKDEGILDSAEVAQFMRRHPDKSRLAELRQAVAEKLKAMEALKNELDDAEGRARPAAAAEREGPMDSTRFLPTLFAAAAVGGCAALMPPAAEPVPGPLVPAGEAPRPAARRPRRADLRMPARRRRAARLGLHRARGEPVRRSRPAGGQPQRRTVLAGIGRQPHHRHGGREGRGARCRRCDPLAAAAHPHQRRLGPPRRHHQRAADPHPQAAPRPPRSCNEATVGRVARVPYTADYIFFEREQA